MKNLIAIAILAVISAAGFAQNEDDALRYSTNYFSGSTRFVSMGGAFGALGGDFGSFSTNPAGLGVYRKSEFVFTPSFSFHNTSSTFGSYTLDDIRYRMNFENMGMVMTYCNDNEEGWVSASFTFGYNRLNDFNRSRIIEGKNNQSSITDYFAAYANGLSYNDITSEDYPFIETPAWDSYLIDPKPGTTDQYQSAFVGTYGETQSKTIDTKGGMGEYVIGLGGNYSNRVYLGGSIGIQSVRYIENMEYKETDPEDVIPAFNKLTYTQNMKTTGSGFNFKFGTIVRVTDWIRVGAAIHTPTFLNLHDEWSTTLQASFNDTLHGDGKIITSPVGIGDYELTTPFRAIGSLGFVIGKSGMLGIDYEFVDYTVARLSSANYMYRIENNTIETAYMAVGNVRAGGEYRFGPFALRAGVGYYPSPYKTGQANANRNTLIYSGGFGIREDDFYFDLGFRKISYEEKYFMYDPSLAPTDPATIKNDSYSIVTTLGFRF